MIEIVEKQGIDNVTVEGMVTEITPKARGNNRLYCKFHRNNH